jgi:1,4-dihydroxy-2-naphthoate octaprenyltransferase
VANNLRDIPTDIEHGKRTLAVRLGDARTRTAVRRAAHGIRSRGARHGVVRAVGAARSARRAAGVEGRADRAGWHDGRELIPVLAATGLYEVAYAVLIALGVVIGVAIAT